MRNFIIVIFCSLLLVFPSIAKNNQIIFIRDIVTIQTSSGDKIYNTEIATSKEQIEYGLMYRNKLPENEAMLFVFKNEQKINMWMKNTLIPLDMLFVDKLGKIIYIARNTTPNSLDTISAGETPALAVLEIRGGEARSQHINVGDRIMYKVFEK